VGQRRTDVDEPVAELLRTARSSLGLPLAFLSRLDDTTQTLEVVDSALPALVREGVTRPRSTSLCQAVLDGTLPAVLPDLAREPVAMALPAARFPRFRSYITVPVRLSDGRLYGTFCAAGLRADPSLGRRDQTLMEVLARAAALVIEPTVREREREAEIRSRLDPVLAGGGPVVLLQPVVRLSDGVRVGAEALSRFPAEWDLPPDVCFAQAHSVGEGVRLELQALEGAARHLDAVRGYVAMNVSPAVLLDPACTALLHLLPLDRVLLELSEHDRVEDYEALADALGPLRAAGLRLAIDDVGAGFSSLRHIVLTAPDVIKLDRSVVTGVASDPVLRRLIASMVDFAHGGGARVVAEGVETEDDATTLRDLGVDDGQGWLFGRPGPAHALGATVSPVALA
jgi:EAL domain-containing protein (putative c-di-GMP-specific phosphodiesterase class I)